MLRRRLGGRVGWLKRKVGSASSLSKFKQHLKEVESDDRLPEYAVTLKDVIPDTPRIDSRGRRINKPDTVVVLTPRTRRSAPALLENAAA